MKMAPEFPRKDKAVKSLLNGQILNTVQSTFFFFNFDTSGVCITR